MNWRIALIPFFLSLLLITVLIIYTKKVNPQVSTITPSLQPSPTPAGNPGWQTFSDSVQKVSFQYPQELPILSTGKPTKYVRTQEWPPKVTVSTGKYSCNEGGLGINGRPDMTIQKEMDSTTYCIKSVNEGAAGTTYTTYTYSFLKNNKLIKLDFILAYPQCDNYPDPKKTECTNERQTFDLDNLINRIARSIKLT